MVNVDVQQNGCMRSVTLDEVLEAAKLDIKDFIKQAKISGAINESINDNS